MSVALFFWKVKSVSVMLMFLKTQICCLRNRITIAFFFLFLVERLIYSLATAKYRHREYRNRAISSRVKILQYQLFSIELRKCCCPLKIYLISFNIPCIIRLLRKNSVNYMLDYTDRYQILHSFTWYDIKWHTSL